MPLNNKNKYALISFVSSSEINFWGARQSPPTSKSTVDGGNMRKSGVYQLRLVVYPMIYRFYMGVSKNSGTPKTPQNDHF